MHITLMRHGKPQFHEAQWLAPFDMPGWIAHDDHSTVMAADIPTTSVKAAMAASVIVASTTSRALASVQALGMEATLADAVLCEAQLPFALWRFPHLPPQFWAALFRLLWLFGYARGSDSIQATRTRAKVAAQQLISLAQKGPVLLVGHGIMNRLIANELLALGWANGTRHASRYWSVSAYEVAANEGLDDQTPGSASECVHARRK